MSCTLRQVHAKINCREVSHLGLRWDRFVPTLADTDDARRQREDFFLSFGDRPRNLSPYRECFEAWKAVLTERGAQVRTWATCSRLTFGAGDESILEVGLRLHHTYGVPVIPGSAQKGLVLRYAPALGITNVTELLGAGGHSGQAAAVAFHDALWAPDGNTAPLAVDTITVHHPEYYQGSSFPADWDSPTPVATLSAQGKFLFAAEGPGAELGLRLLGAALRDIGIGARTLKGYGRFAVPATEALPTPGAIPVPLFEGVGPLPGAHHRAVAAPFSSQPVAELVAERVSVTFAPGSGRLQAAIPFGSRSLKAEVAARAGGLFESDAVRDAFIARCRKKGFALARIRYLQDGTMVTIQHIDPQG